MYVCVYAYIYIHIHGTPPLKPTFLTCSSDGWVKRGLPYIHAKGVIYDDIYEIYMKYRFILEYIYKIYIYIF